MSGARTEITIKRAFGDVTVELSYRPSPHTAFDRYDVRLQAPEELALELLGPPLRAWLAGVLAGRAPESSR